jgi:hypothetical protein
MIKVSGRKTVRAVKPESPGIAPNINPMITLIIIRSMVGDVEIAIIVFNSSIFFSS